jgi:hypothetical protein
LDYEKYEQGQAGKQGDMAPEGSRDSIAFYSRNAPGLFIYF